MDITELQNRHDTALALVKEALAMDTELTYSVSTFAYGNGRHVALNPDIDASKLEKLRYSITTILVNRGKKRVFTILAATISRDTEWNALVSGESCGAFVCDNEDDMQMLLSEYNLDCPPPVLTHASDRGLYY